jgi:general secretion pathway protein A
MYEEFFGFRERPFDLTPNPRYLVLTESHREALSNLIYGIASRKGITLLIGEAGSGKTTVIRAAIEQQPVKVHCVHVHNPTLSRVEFVEMLSTRFGLSEQAVKSKAAMLLELEELLRRRHALGETTVLVIDEAQSLPLNLLEEIRLLANIETNHEKLLSVIIAGQPELADRLNNPTLRQLKQRVALRCQLRALTPPETASYIAGRVKAAGAEDTQVFTREAVGLIHERAQGLPRTISVIADNALLGGFAAGQKPVGSAVVWDVCADFDIGPKGDLSGSSRTTRTNGERGAGQPERREAPAPERSAYAESRLLPARPQGAASGRGPDAPEGNDGRRRPQSEMFNTFAPKRKRFSFFWG